MNGTTRVKPETDTAIDFDAIVRDLAALRQDFTDLMSQMKSEALKGANGAADSVTAQGEHSVKAVGRQVEERPVVSLLVAFGVGFIASRLLMR